MHNGSLNMNDRGASPKDRIRGLLVVGTVTIAGLLGGMAAWAFTTKIDGAVIALGLVALETNRQTVQHLEGGIIAEIKVREDEAVKKGQVLIRLNTTQDQSELDAVSDQITSLTVQHARLTAEIQNNRSLIFSETLKELAAEDKDVDQIIRSELQLFETRSASQNANKNLLNRRKVSLEAQIEGLRSQNVSLSEDLDLTREEKETLATLEEKKLVPITRTLEVRRNILGLQANISGNLAQIESLNAQINEIDSELISAKARLQEEIASQVAVVEQQLRQLKEQRITIIDKLKRSEILAPQDGRVLNLAFHTTGGVIAPGQSVMDIVPVKENAILLARVPVADVERVLEGQKAVVRLTAFNRNQTPELNGIIRSVSADTLTDPVTNIPYYNAEIKLSDAELDRLSGQKLVPGMPVEVLITTGERLVASYVARPLVDAYAQTFRDE